MVLKCPTSFFARPLEFAYRARFSPAPPDSGVSVQGQRHLRAQSFDPARSPLSGYAQIDQKLLEIRTQARRIPLVRDSELNDFLGFLAVVGGIAGQSLQDNLFPGKCSESEFQKKIKALLRLNCQIGSQLEEHPRAAGGITDLSFKGIRLELKVEADQLASAENISQYLQQTSQYVAGSDRRFGLLCVLDCADKTAAPGSA